MLFYEILFINNEIKYSIHYKLYNYAINTRKRIIRESNNLFQLGPSAGERKVANFARHKHNHLNRFLLPLHIEKYKFKIYSNNH